MTGFSLPPTHADTQAAFFDPGSATAWLGRQPQANAPAMLAALLEQIHLYNTVSTPAQLRFATLDSLRHSVFSVSANCQHRFEHKPLPLLPAEQATLDAVRELWRAYATGYVRCLQASLEQDISVSGISSTLAHRALCCLRMEQLNGYLAASEPSTGFWHTLHAIYACAEHLGATRTPIADRHMGETRESTVSGQYCMALLLHLACPFSLPRRHFAALNRWLARWREQAEIVTPADNALKSCCLALDLAQDCPLHDPQPTSSTVRWLSLNGVLRKMRKRVDRLSAGESPENLKLGSGLAADTCISLLKRTAQRLRSPQPIECDPPQKDEPVLVATGLENIHRALGGRSLEALSPQFRSKLNADRLAIFGHIPENENRLPIQTETWWLRKQQADRFELQRPSDQGGARVALNHWLAIKMPQSPDFALASINQMFVRQKKPETHLYVTACHFRGESATLFAEARDKWSGKNLCYPALLLSEKKSTGQQASIVVPSELTARSVCIRFFDGQKRPRPDLQLGELIERRGDSEHWSPAPSADEG